MLHDALLFLSAGVFIITLLDILLSDTQKDQISRLVLYTWDTLDDLKTIPFLETITSNSDWTGLLITSAFAREHEDLDYTSIFIILITSVSVFPLLLSFILSAKNIIGISIRFALVVVAISLAPLVIGVAIDSVYPVSGNINDMPPPTDLDPQYAVNFITMLPKSMFVVILLEFYS